jgi:hypothetical protein
MDWARLAQNAITVFSPKWFMIRTKRRERNRRDDPRDSGCVLVDGERPE